MLFFLLLPNFQNYFYRAILFIARSFTFSYTLYFFFVFVPFTPLGVLALFFLGVGALILTPIVVMVIHLYKLTEDFNYLKQKIKGFILISLFILSFLVIPIFIYKSYSYDRNILFSAIDYVYKPNYAKNDYKVDSVSLEKSLLNLKKHNKRSFRNMSVDTPFLSSLYNSLVLDNLTLSSKKIKTLENIFFGNQNYIEKSQIVSNENLQIKNIDINTTFDKKTSTYKSFVNLEIENLSDTVQEYKTLFKLPIGAYISDYYLGVLGERKKGILTDKKSAMWIYNQITTTKKDPGVLHYDDFGNIIFKIFPFNPKEIRKSGFEIIHIEPISFEIDNKQINLQTKELESAITFNDTLYIPKNIKKGMPKVDVDFYYHFIIDTSINQEESFQTFVNQIKTFVSQNNISQNQFKITTVNSVTKEYNLDEFVDRDFKGGFYLNRAIKEIFYNYSKDNSKYPIIVVFSNHTIQKSFQTALYLEKLKRDYLLEGKNLNEDWRNIVNQSFNSHILTLFSSFIVVENQAQENMILEKQKEVLKADSSLDLHDETKRDMSEPSLFLMIGLLVLLFVMRNRIKKLKG